MANITLKGTLIHTRGELPAVGSKAPDFKLLNADLERVTLATFSGKKKILNIFPSIDTPVCATSVRTFNENASKLKNTVIMNIASDLPFAQKRFCAAEGMKNCVTLSTFNSTFPQDWKVEITDSPLAGLCSRAIVVLDEDNTVIYTEQVPEIAQEPNYEKALKAAS